MRRVVRRGDVIFDIGAHMGLHTVLLSALTGDTGAVHAFEVIHGVDHRSGNHTPSDKCDPARIWSRRPD